MASNITIARPYAKALFEYAMAHDQVSAWLEVLSVLAITLSQAELLQLLNNPEQSQTEVVDLLQDVVNNVSADRAKELADSLQNYLKLLAEAKRLDIMSDISRAFHLHYAEQQGVIEADVVSAHALSDDQRQKLQQQLEQRFNTKVELSFDEDADLMGGMVITAGNWVMNGSIKGKIARLDEDLLT
ncbi:MAG: F0F1 ATP synthase subunit delta [Coxiellaceae bacterium]|nr:F0F1 ATP synthase subunit delta [Coxiellaceae bacterium]